MFAKSLAVFPDAAEFSVFPFDFLLLSSLVSFSAFGRGSKTRSKQIVAFSYRIFFFMTSFACRTIQYGNDVKCPVFVYRKSKQIIKFQNPKHNNNVGYYFILPHEYAADVILLFVELYDVQNLVKISSLSFTI